MARQKDPNLDKIFLALGHPSRRTILTRLQHGRATVMEIAGPFDTSLNAISKHLKVLEKAGLIEREVRGREHFCGLRPGALNAAAHWLVYYQSFWAERLDALEQELIARKRSQSSRKG